MQDEDRQTQEAFDATTGEAMALTPPRVEDQALVPRSEAGQGLDPVEFARPSFESAVERFRSAGAVDVDPDDPALFNAYRRSMDYLGDMALGGLDLTDAAFKAAVGIVSQALPEDQERRFARDMVSMPETFMGYSPGRIQSAADRVAEGVSAGLRSIKTPDISTQKVSPTFNTKLFDDEDFGVASPTSVSQDYTPAPMYIEGFDFLTPEEGFLDLKRVTEQNAKDFDESTILGSLARDRLKIFDNFSQEELFDVAKGLPHFNDPNYINYLRQNISPLSSKAKVSTANFLELINDISSYFPAKPDPMRENVSERFLPYRSPIGQRAFPESLPAPSDPKAEALGFEDIVYHSSISPEEFAEFDLDKGFGSQVRNSQDLLGVHVGTARAAAERNLQASSFDPVGFTMELRARTDKPFNRQALGELFTAKEIEDIQRRNPRDDFSPDSPLTENELSGLVNAYERKMFEGEILPENSRELAAIALRRDLASSEFTHIPYMNDVEDPGSTSFIMLVDRPRTSPAVLRDVRAQFDPEQITNPDLRFAEGGVVSMEEQMSLFDMGGLTDDGAMRDPVSGNEVPPGSMASEVRDDVPAMLSEGEYIVPADVVRYYGVKFFEDLRSQAKSGLMDMERNGRIGGEPVDAPMAGGDLTPEEMAMLAEITGMYQGGMVAGNPMMVNPMPNVPDRRMMGFNEGGLQPGVANMTQEDFMNQANQGGGFQLPRSIFTPPATTTPTTQTPTFTPVMLYSPTGIAILASSQEQYNDLIGQGYTTSPSPTPVTPSESDGGGGDDGGPPGGTGGGFSLSDENREALANDPLKFGTEALGVEMPFGADTRDVAGLGLIAAGPAGALAGGFVGAAMELDNIAKAKAGLEVARSQGLSDTPEFAALDTAVKAAEKNLSGPARFLSNVLGFGDGKNYAASVTGMTPTPPTRAGVTPPGGGVTPPGSEDGDVRTPTVTPEASRTAQAPATSSRPTGRPDASQTSPAGTASRAAAEARNAESRAAEADRAAAARAERAELGRTGGAAAAGTGGKGSQGKGSGIMGMNPGGLVARPSRKKPVAKKK